MLPAFQEGRRPRPNAHASLLNTGHVSPLARRPGAGAAQHAHLLGPTARPGPRPLSARQTAAVNAQNARIRREVDQVLADCRREVQLSNDKVRRAAASLSFDQINYEQHKKGREGQDVFHEAVRVPGTFQDVEATRYRAGALWVYATTFGTGWGDHTYYVYNPDTHVIIEFAPESALKGAARHRYGTWAEQGRGLAAGTGVAGGYMEKGFLGLGALFLTGGVAAELGAYAYVAEEVAPVVARVAAPYLTRKVLTGAAVRASTDLGVQLVSGFATSKGSFLQRGGQALRSVNGSSVIVAGIINTEGLKMEWLGKLLVAGGTAAAGNLVTLSYANRKQFGSAWHGVDFHDSDQRWDFAESVALSAVLDRSKDVLAERGAEQLARIARKTVAGTIGRAEPALLRTITATHITLPLTIGIGTGFETGKKTWENQKEVRRAAEKEAQKAQIKAHEHPIKNLSTGHSAIR